MDPDPTKLTSFNPISTDNSNTGFSFTRWITDLGKRKDSVPKAPQPSQDQTGNAQTANAAPTESLVGACKDNSKVDKAPEEKQWLSESVATKHNVTPEVRLTLSEHHISRKEKWRYRNVRTILRRLSALAIDRRWRESSGDFKHNFKQYWMPDEHCKECYECSDKFNTFRRRHHCRVCGQIFCNSCCNKEVPGKVMGFGGEIRVCNYCHKIVQAYLNDDLEKSIKDLNEDMKAMAEPSSNYDIGSNSTNSVLSSKSSFIDENRLRKAGSSTSLASLNGDRSTTPNLRSPFDAFGVAPSEASTIKQDYLRDLWRQITDQQSDLQLQSHRFHMKTYHNCLIGNELVDWLLTHSKANNRPQAVSIAQTLLDYGWIEHVYSNEETIFRDEYMLYQPTKLANLEASDSSKSVACQVLSSSNSPADSMDKVLYKEEEEEDETLPAWFRQLNNKNENNFRSSGRQFASSNRRLDLDQDITTSTSEVRKGDMSLQMSLKSHKDYESSQGELYDQKSRVSLITHVPPPPLDTYVCVEGHQPVSKRKPQKQSSASQLHEDILHGVVFPRPSSEITDDGDSSEEQPRDEGSGERLAKERLLTASQHHIKALLEQLLKQDQLASSWEDVIMPFISRVSEKVIPDVRRGDDMDIRQYVWFTKVPGGKKIDSHFISGVVFTKNVVHKKMTGFFQQPKILMMNCSIDYQRNESKMASLDPLILQEYEFLKNFPSRILALKPNLLLVEKSVARVAQDMLLHGGVTLVHNIKPQVMQNIARCTGADILQSMEQVTRPRLGTCQVFRLQRYALPNGGAKTLMYFEGCAPDLGCSLVLRGGNEKTLAKVKTIIRYLIYVSYNLKLEAKFLMDEFAMPPQLDQLTPSCELYKDAGSMEFNSIGTSSHALCLSPKGEQTTKELTTEAGKFQHALMSIILSSSPFCSYTMPYLLTGDGLICPCRGYIPETIYWSRYLEGSVAEPIQMEEDYTDWVENEDVVNPNVIIKSPHAFTDPSLIQYIDDPMAMGRMLADFRARGGQVDLKMYRESERREHKRLYGAHAEPESYALNHGDDFGSDGEDGFDEGLRLDFEDPKKDCFDAYNHQKIAVLFSSFSKESNNSPNPCVGPWTLYMEFYARNDITLGEFLERYCFRSSYICPSHNCDVPMVNHVRYFAHGRGSLHIHMRNLESPIPGYDRTILIWSWCKVCKQVTPVVPLSFESSSMSFAKYLELRFYGHKYSRRASVEPCQHSLHHEHFQYFSYGNMVASFKYSPVNLNELVIPSLDIRISKKRDPMDTCKDVEIFSKKSDAVMAVIMDRIYSFKADDPAPNAVRDANIREFAADLTKEHMNLQDCVQILRRKANGLCANADGYHRRDTFKGSVSSISAIEESHSLEDSIIEVTDEEADTVMRDISNQLFHLKKNLCEIVENWNSRLQEFHQQEKKREKQTLRSSSPTKPTTPVTAEMSDYYHSQEGEKGVSQNNPQFSEVYLTDGKILRQTYTENAAPKSPANASPTVSRKNESSLLAPKLEVKVEPKAENLTEEERTAEEARKKVGSPYALIKTPKFEATPNKTQDASQVDGPNTQDSLNEETTPTSQSDKNTIPLDPLTKGKCSSPQVTKNDVEKSNQQVSDDTKPNSAEGISVVKPISKDSMMNTTNPKITATEDTANIRTPERSRKESFTDVINGVRTAQMISEAEQLFIDSVRNSTQARKRTDRDEHSNMSEQGSDCGKSHTSDKLYQREVDLSDLDNAPWIAVDRETQPSLLEEFGLQDPSGYSSEGENSMMVEYNSEPDDLTDVHSDTSIDDMQHFLESEAPSETDTGHEAADDEAELSDPDDSIRFGESAVDFRLRGFESPNTGSDSDTDPYYPDRIRSLTSTKPFVPPRSHRKYTTYTDFPTREEKIEKVEYLTPKEVKAMQDARRRKKLEHSKTKVAKRKDDSNTLKVQTDTKSTTAEPDQAEIDMIDNETKRYNRKRESIQNPLLKRLVDSPKDIIIRESQLKPIVSESYSYSQTKPGYAHKISKPYTVHPLDTHSRQNRTLDEQEFQRSISTVTNYAQRQLGHRRMKSAPSCVVRLESNEMQSKHMHEHLYSKEELLNRKKIASQSIDDLSNIKSLRTNSEGQLRLSKMAERICFYDLKDSERDDPEVLQTDGLSHSNLDVSMKALMNSDRLNMSSEAMKNSAQMDSSQKDNSMSFTHDKGANEEVSAVISKKGERSEKMKKIISQFLPSSNFQPIPRPFPSHEHFAIHSGDALLNVVINEKEPTSIIAFTLSSLEYQQQLTTIQDYMLGRSSIIATQLLPNSQSSTPSPMRKVLASPVAATAKISEQGDDVVVYRSGSRSSAARPRSWAGLSSQTATASDMEPQLTYKAQLPHLSGVDGSSASSDVGLKSAVEDDGRDSCDDILDDKVAEDKKKASSLAIDYHIKHQFQSDSANFVCNVYFAEQFRKLRELIFPEGEDRYIQSLARCMFWKATGGKSGSSFSKSMDDRFVMKQMSRLEVQSFVDFAPRYFEYINKAMREKQPTALAKLLGVYRIGYRNSDTNTTMRQDVLVMENLFYQKKVNKIYDLKGSVRSRYVHTPAKEDVLMDENLLEMIAESPLFIRPHSKAILSKAIHNDTEFLYTNMVMDYSLLVGIDETNLRLVVGVIDYIRTYTWDKKLESYVKSSGILGGQGKMPTVVSPEVYKTRFTEAMTRYFLMVPDKWTGFGADHY